MTGRHGDAGRHVMPSANCPCPAVAANCRLFVSCNTKRAGFEW